METLDANIIKKVKKGKPTINNGLKELIERFRQPGRRNARLSYAKETARRLLKEHGMTVSENNIHLIANNHQGISCDTIIIAETAKKVLTEMWDRKQALLN